MNKNLRVSIVIPVYNEAEHLAACLQAIGRQTVAPYEVVVVDNNSSDDTAMIAGQFPFVRLLVEPRQGVVYARDRGFDAARGQIIGRIDADSLISENWVWQTQQLFLENEELAAVTGSVTYYGLVWSRLLDRFDLIIRRRLARLLGREVAMQGANMAMRRSAWQRVRSHLCREPGLHEDHDIAVHLSQTGQLVAFDERLVSAIDCRRLETNWRDFCNYALLSPRTYAKHGLSSQRHMYPAVILVIICYLPLKLLHRSYDKQIGGFSWQQLLFATVSARVNPATFVE